MPPLTPLLACALAAMPVHERVAKAELIAIAEVVAIEKNPDARDTKDQARIHETARKIAIVEIRQLIKAPKDSAIAKAHKKKNGQALRLRVGFKTDDIFDTARFQKKARYLLFLKKPKKTAYHVAIAGQFGALKIDPKRGLIGALFGSPMPWVSIADAADRLQGIISNRNAGLKPEECPYCPNPEEDA